MSKSGDALKKLLEENPQAKIDRDGNIELRPGYIVVVAHKGAQRILAEHPRRMDFEDIIRGQGGDPEVESFEIGQNDFREHWD